MFYFIFFFFFQAEDGIRDVAVTGFRRVLFRSCDVVGQEAHGRPFLTGEEWDRRIASIDERLDTAIQLCVESPDIQVVVVHAGLRGLGTWSELEGSRQLAGDRLEPDEFCGNGRNRGRGVAYPLELAGRGIHSDRLVET